MYVISVSTGVEHFGSATVVLKGAVQIRDSTIVKSQCSLHVCSHWHCVNTVQGVRSVSLHLLLNTSITQQKPEQKLLVEQVRIRENSFSAQQSLEKILIVDQIREWNHIKCEWNHYTHSQVVTRVYLSCGLGAAIRGSEVKSQPV